MESEVGANYRKMILTSTAELARFGYSQQHCAISPVSALRLCGQLHLVREVELTIDLAITRVIA